MSGILISHNSLINILHWIQRNLIRLPQYGIRKVLHVRKRKVLAYLGCWVWLTLAIRN